MMQKLDILDEREHALSILRRLDGMKQDQQHCDFIVSVGGVEFHTHRNILSAGSDYFNAMLTHDTKEIQLGKVEMMDVDSECVGICLNYIYTGKAEVPEGKTEQLLGVATLMQLNKLTNALSLLLQNYLDINNFYSTRRIADLYNLQDLLATCRTFERENILSLSSQDSFQIEQGAHIIEILNSVALTEKQRLILSLQWAGRLTERKSTLLDFLKSINFEEVPKDFLHNILKNNPLVKNDFDLYKDFDAPPVKKVKTDRNDNYASSPLILFDETCGCLQQFNPRTNIVEKFHEANFAEFQSFSAIALHSFIYILSGDKSVHRLKFLEKKAKWEKMQDMIECHGHDPPSVSVNGFLYVIGGSICEISSAAEKYYPSENRWAKLEDKPVPTVGAALVAIRGFIYSIGGETQQERVSDAFYQFDSRTSEWTELEPMRQARHSCGAVAVNQKIYVFGGSATKDILSCMDCYDVTVRQWTRLSPMIEKHSLINAHHVSGWIFAMERLEYSNETEKYNIERDEWQKVGIKGIVNFEIYDSVMT